MISYHVTISRSVSDWLTEKQKQKWTLGHLGDSGDPEDQGYSGDSGDSGGSGDPGDLGDSGDSGDPENPGNPGDPGYSDLKTVHIQWSHVTFSKSDWVTEPFIQMLSYL